MSDLYTQIRVDRSDFVRPIYKLAISLSNIGKMNKNLENILELENRKEFENAFKSYEHLYSKDKQNFEVWKYFYFFLWIIIENMPNDFVEKINREERLKNMYYEGKQNFSELAEFNFIVGYTMSIFPYEFGNFEEHEKLSAELLKKAKTLESNNPICEMSYLSNINDENENYKTITVDAGNKAIKDYDKIGLLNDYFKQVLYRIKK